MDSENTLINKIDCERLAQLLFPNVTKAPEDIEAQYPRRELPEGAKVTRFAPSPTGFVHFGGMFPVTVGERLAHRSGGVFYLRIEDTDAKREVPGAAKALITTLAHYGINFDEGAILNDEGEIADCGSYGPYKQSERASIYHVYAKDLVRKGLAYPVFSTEQELEALANTDKKTEIKNKDWHSIDAEKALAQARKMREFTIEDVEGSLERGEPFVLRILADGNAERKGAFTDLIKGKLELPENDEDFVLLKSDGIPTYHFAHAVDDHLMGTTHVIRGEEWLPSLPKHIMLFRYLGFKTPKYLHIAQLMHLDENGSKKKLSKRDMGANMEDYNRIGYAPEAVMEYVMTLLNSNYEEWHTANPDKNFTDFDFSIKKMSTSGCLFDFEKLNDVSKNVVSRMSSEEVYTLAAAWAEKFSPEFYAEFTKAPEFSKAALSIGRTGKKPRKDFAVWSELEGYLGFFYDKYFEIKEAYPEKFDKEIVKKVLMLFIETYDEADEQSVWFDKIKAVADSIGFASDMKAYKQNPDAFPGNVGDVSMFIRIAVTGKTVSPDMYEVMRVLGTDKVKERINREIDRLK